MKERDLFGPDHDAFRDTVRRFVASAITPRYEEFAAAHAIARDVWLAAGELGLLGLDVPAEYGGAEAGDYRFNAVLIEELTRASAATASAFAIHADIVVPYLVHLGTPEQRERWLPGMARGETITAIAMTEPGAGSDLAGVRTRAVRDGDGWRLDGTKTFITNGAIADLVLVVARTSDRGARGLSLFLVERGTPGFSVGKVLDKVGQPDANTTELVFDGVRVPGDHLLGELDGGFGHLMEHLPRERIGSAVSNLAHARTAFEETLEHVRQREAFGQPIGRFQHNAFLLADLATRLDVTQAYVDRCIAAHAVDDLTPTEAAKAKWWTSEVQGQVIDACVQLHGGYGYMTEYRVARAWADARVTRIWAGTTEIMKLLIARELGLA